MRKKDKGVRNKRHDARKDAFELAANKKNKNRQKRSRGGARQEQDSYLAEYEEYLSQKGE